MSETFEIETTVNVGDKLRRTWHPALTAEVMYIGGRQAFVVLKEGDKSPHEAVTSLASLRNPDIWTKIHPKPAPDGWNLDSRDRTLTRIDEHGDVVLSMWRDVTTGGLVLDCNKTVWFPIIDPDVLRAGIDYLFPRDAE